MLTVVKKHIWWGIIVRTRNSTHSMKSPNRGILEKVAEYVYNGN